MYSQHRQSTQTIVVNNYVIFFLLLVERIQKPFVFQVCEIDHRQVYYDLSGQKRVQHQGFGLQVVYKQRQYKWERKINYSQIRKMYNYRVDIMQNIQIVLV
eukprot:TRINITY_DN293_c0_g1_i3.p5 TRINITY_DN293_c0_g1~~TRINITY_DN293_c0_g1_i3.p5  ORF type:complete len:101 (-),score=0.26 TRINITY_DN293_c0_g1_i3:239-541(-)